MLPAPAAAFDYKALPPRVVAELRKQAGRIRDRLKSTTAAIIEIGCDLLAVKQSSLEHGQFTQWVEAECGFTVRTAENYIRAAEFAEGKNETVSLLPPAAVYKLAAKSTPPALVQEVMERVESGKLVNTTEVAAALADARFKKRERKRQERDAARRQKKSKRTLAQEEARRCAEEARRQQEKEKLRLRAVGLIEAIGEDHAKTSHTPVSANTSTTRRALFLLPVWATVSGIPLPVWATNWTAAEIAGERPIGNVERMNAPRHALGFPIEAVSIFDVVPCFVVYVRAVSLVETPVTAPSGCINTLTSPTRPWLTWHRRAISRSDQCRHSASSSILRERIAPFPRTRDGDRVLRHPPLLGTAMQSFEVQLPGAGFS